MLSIAIFLLVFNIFLTGFFYFKLKKRFSDNAEIASIKKEVYKLISDITFQTEQSVTIIEDKLHEVNLTIAEVDKHILIAKKEEENRARTGQMLQNLSAESSAQSEIKPKTKKQSPETAASKKRKQNTNEEIKTPEMFPAGNSEPIKIYTKQILSNRNRTGIQENFFREQIIEMARKGFSADLIADKVPLPIGEIELIISMNV